MSQQDRRWGAGGCWLVVVAASACSPTKSVVPVEKTPSPAVAAPAPSPTASAPAADSKSDGAGAEQKTPTIRRKPSDSPESAPAVPAASPLPVTGPFPPPPFEPMHARTARDSDGTWTTVPEGQTQHGAVIAQATIHPHPFKKWVFVTALAFDRRHVSLQLVAGTDEPSSDVVPKERRPGLVPEEAQPRLLSVFNGGFKLRHGNYGMRVGGDTFSKPIEDACAVGLDDRGRVRVGPWKELGQAEAQLNWFRQTPPCLVVDGKVNPRLDAEHRTRHWGAAVGGVYDIRRSALALDPSGRSVIYAFGDWVTAKEFATALAAMGLTRAAQLDINWSYTRFFLFEQKPDAGPRIRRTLIPKLKYSKNRYVEKPSYRDFFYVTARP